MNRYALERMDMREWLNPLTFTMYHLLKMRPHNSILLLALLIMESHVAIALHLLSRFIYDNTIP